MCDVSVGQGFGEKLDEILGTVAVIKSDVSNVQISINRLEESQDVDVWSAASTTYDQDIMDELERQMGGRLCSISQVHVDDAPEDWPELKGKMKDAAFVRPAHLFPRTKGAQMHRNRMFGKRASYPADFDLNGARNVLMMRFALFFPCLCILSFFLSRYDIEHAFDHKYIVLYPKDLDYTKYVVIVVRDNVDKQVARNVSEKFTIKDKNFNVIASGAKRWENFGLSVSQFHGEDVHFPEMKSEDTGDDIRPYTRVLGYHMQLAVRTAREEEWVIRDGVDLDVLEDCAQRMRGRSRVNSFDAIVEEDDAIEMRDAPEEKPAV